MSHLRCPYCSSTQSGHTTSPTTSRSLTECSSCGRIIQEHPHPPIHISLFPLRSHLNPLPLVTPDLQQLVQNKEAELSIDKDEEGDPFHPTGFITAFSTFSLERSPLLARAAPSPFSGLLSDLQRSLESSDCDDPMVSVDHLRAYLHILDVASILGLEHDVSEHAFQLFKDCLLVACLRNRSVEALATAALVQAIREAQEPRTLQATSSHPVVSEVVVGVAVLVCAGKAVLSYPLEKVADSTHDMWGNDFFKASPLIRTLQLEISTASSLPQKEIGKYMKILGEALKLSQPINSNSISVHMPRFCTLLQLNKSAQELAAHIGEVVINKCFCTRRNPISISAAAIYLACQLEDKRKTQAEICKVTGLTEVTLRKVYKELLENWDDLLPPNYTPAVPPEKAFPMTSISSGRSSTPKVENPEMSDVKKPSKDLDAVEIEHEVEVIDEMENKSGTHERSLASLYTRDLNQAAFWQPQFQFGVSTSKQGEKQQRSNQGVRVDEAKFVRSECEQHVGTDLKTNNPARRTGQASTISSSQKYATPWQFNVPGPSSSRFGKPQPGFHSGSGHQGSRNKAGNEAADS